MLSGNTVSQDALDVCTGSGGAGIALLGQGSTQVIGNVVSGNTSSGDAGGILEAQAGSPLIEGNVISRNLAGRGGAGDGGGLEIAVAGHVAVVQNLIVDNQVLPCPDVCGFGGGAFVGAPSGDALLLNNTFAGNVPDGVFLTGAGGALQVTGNIVEAPTGSAAVICDQRALPHVTFASNDAVGTAGAGYDPNCGAVAGTHGNISADPRFGAATKGDFHLSSGSAALGAGDATAPGLPARDLDGNPRRTGATVDLGVYEAPSTAAPGV